MPTTAISRARCQADVNRVDLSSFESATEAATEVRDIMQRALVFMTDDVACNSIALAIDRLNAVISDWKLRDTVPEMNPHIQRFLGDYLNKLHRNLADG